MGDQSVLRRRLFEHLNGLVLVPIAHSLRERGVLAFLESGTEVALTGLTTRFGGNPGYLNVALRCLASNGFLHYRLDEDSQQVFCQARPQHVRAFTMFRHYQDVVHLLGMSVKARGGFSAEVLAEQARLGARLQQGWIPATSDPADRDLRERILLHIEGGIVGPLLVQMGMSGAFRDLDGIDFTCPGDTPDRRRIIEFLVWLGWLGAGSDVRVTETGRFFFGKAAAYGVPVSYLPMLTRAPDLIFGDPAAVTRSSIAVDEMHVDRRMNVWGSGNTHGSYFRALEEIVVELFNRPIAEQPAGILDMGCGDGALLMRLHRAIASRTLRGRMLGRHPLRLFGVDYNSAALEAARQNLREADVPVELLWGDIGQPDLLAAALRDGFAVDLGDLLNMRTFLDHNRPWAPATRRSVPVPHGSTGAFSHRGIRLHNGEVEDSLREHLARWAPHVGRHGLLIVELHTIAVDLAARHTGSTLAPAYDATHGLSDQYIVEIDILARAAASAGLLSDRAVHRRFPDSELATISLNLFRAAGRQSRIQAGVPNR